MVFAGLLAVSSSVEAAQKSSLTTINLCVTKAGPDKGSVRFVQAKLKCKKGELRVQAVSNPSQQGVLGIQETSGEAGRAGPKGAKGIQGPQGPQGPAGPNGATGYLRIENTSATATASANAPETASTTATCTGGRKVVGGGYLVNAGPVTEKNNPAEVTVTQSRATSDTVWSVSAVTDDSGDVGPWTITAYAICAYVGS